MLKRESLRIERTTEEGAFPWTISETCVCLLPPHLGIRNYVDWEPLWRSPCDTTSATRSNNRLEEH